MIIVFENQKQSIRPPQKTFIFMIDCDETFFKNTLSINLAGENEWRIPGNIVIHELWPKPQTFESKGDFVLFDHAEVIA